MFKEIKNLPGDVLGIEMVGKITHEDYKEFLIPKVEEIIAEKGDAKVLCVIGPEWDGYELSAMWDDTKFGIMHWSEFSKIALVTDHEWIKGMTAMFTPFFPGEVRMFRSDQFDQAKNWISE